MSLDTDPTLAAAAPAPYLDPYLDPYLEPVSPPAYGYGAYAAFGAYAAGYGAYAAFGTAYAAFGVYAASYYCDFDKSYGLGGAPEAVLTASALC